MNKLFKHILATALVLSMTIGSMTSAFAVTSEALSNKVDENAIQVSKVDNVNRTGNFKVNMSDSGDEITVYKLASMNWDAVNNTFSEPVWVSEVANWLGAGGAGAALYGSYNTPDKLAAATSSIQTDFFKAVLGKTDGITGPTLLTSYNSETDTTKILKTNSTDQIVVNDSTLATTNLTKGTGYQLSDGSSTTIYMIGDNYNGTLLSSENVGAVTPGLTSLDIYYSTADTTKRYVEGDIFQNAANGYFTVKEVDLGIYGILGHSGEKVYAPATVNLIPQRDGAVGNWYLSGEIETNLKAANVTMEKTINGKKSDIVQIGEDVDFEITYTLPKYTARTINNNTAQYTLTFDDELSDAFSLDTSSVVVKYRTDGSTEWKDASVFNPDYYSSFIAAPATDTNGDGSVLDEYGLVLYGCSVSHLYLYTIYRNCYKHYITTSDSALAGYTASDATHSKPFVTGASWDDDNQAYYLRYYAYYYYRDGAYHLLKNDTPNKSYAQYYGSGSTVNVQVTPSTSELTSNEVRALYSAETYDTIGHGWTYFPYGGSTKANTDSYYHNVFNITFDYAKIILNDDLYKHDVTVQITYKAQVNQDIATGVETNTNTATMKYEANSAGTIFSTISDTVKAYTYGVNIVKIDGDTVNSDTKTYISGAQFRLYKETDTFVNDLYAGKMSDSDTTGLDVGTSTLADYKETHTGDDNYYYYEYTAAEAGTLDNTVAYQANDKITRVFKLYTLSDKRGSVFDGTATSVSTAQGVTIKGLDTGNYVLKETAAPQGYNELAEDVLFSIYALDADNAETNYGGSYKVYADTADGTVVTDDDGVYPLSVLNYKGLVLPSTGGMGTVLFTLIGLLLMLAAILVVVAKNRKKARNIASFLLAILMVGALVMTDAQSANAITEVTLNNQYGTLVTGNNTVSFKVDLKNAGDTVEIYQISNLGWDTDASTYTGPDWVLGVQDAVNANDIYKTVAATPAALGAQDTSVQIAFLDWIYQNRTTNNLQQSNLVSNANIVLAQDGMSYTVSGVPYGSYMIKARNSATQKEYQLLTVDAMPTQQGPVGAWYLKENISASLKFADISVNKTIDGKKGETVKNGQKVAFNITGEVPSYPGVADVNGDLQYDSYPYAVTDTMSAAFDYVVDDGVTVKYTTDAAITDDTTWVDVPTANYTSIFKKAAANTSSEGMMLYKDNSAGQNPYMYCEVTKPSSTFTMVWYAYNPAKGVLTRLGQTTGSTVSATFSDATITAAYVAATGVTATSFTRTNVADFVGLQNVTFDYDYLHTQNAANVQISYNANVTSSAVVGADTNNNTATFYYQKNLAGDTGTKEATATAWTYAVNVVKSDGDKVETYLADARFKLYQEAYTFVPNADSLDPTKANYTNYVYSSSKNGYEGTYANLNELDTEVGGDYYYRIVNIDAADGTPCTDENCERTGAHSHIIAYALYTFKDENDADATVITSVANAAGVTISGLAPASYVLIETEAPNGYNRLEEALRFEINEITTAQAQTLYGSESLKGFISDEVSTDSAEDSVTVEGVNYKAYTDGVYPINVKNFAGLTLPSTGGMGTLLFTIIGVLLMVTVLIIIVSKRKKDTYQ